MSKVIIKIWSNMGTIVSFITLVSVIITLAYSVLSSADRQAIRDYGNKVNAIGSDLDYHKSENDTKFKEMNDKMDRILQSMNGTNAKLNQIIGKLEIIERK